jgi:type IV fimbrial biogenesis protein FimT
VLRAAQARGAAAGFTLIELMLVITISAILLMLGVPALRGVVENTRIRAVSESLKYGLDVARNEAVRLNTQVEFVSSATGWQVRRVADASVLRSGTGKEGRQQVALTFTPVGADRVTFDSFGRTVGANPSDGSVPLTRIDIASAKPPGVSGYRPMRVQVLAGGVSRLCDPAVGATDPRACL